MGDHPVDAGKNHDMRANITLVMGGARSGKSSYASRLALSACPAPVYVATARVFDGDAEFEHRVTLHKKARGAPWVDVEEQKTLSAHAETFRGKAVVIDCCTLWLTNFFLDAKSDGEAALAAVKAEFDRMVKQWDTSFIFVSNEIGSGVHAETAMGRGVQLPRCRPERLPPPDAESSPPQPSLTLRAGSTSMWGARRIGWCSWWRGSRWS